ncbi:DUF4397 domain-containing protein [Saliphagus infecundisoli]|uniref:DUF4397 domain-containing protein n=1 Tax=Saliphagus infecundisoli TaxID=1849069 RepID=A0ABD5QA69_9EURY|nr:DUF4397 domain-containing protein [Saliphagus infecundisoli]
MTDKTRRRFLQIGSGAVLLGGVGHVVADDHNESDGGNESGEMNESGGMNESDGEMEATAMVTFEDQTTDGTWVTVAEAMLPEGGFVTIHDSSLLDGEVLGSVIGVSEAMEAGEMSDVEVPLFGDIPGTDFDREMLEEDETLIAMPHMDSNDSGAYEFVESEGEVDGPYVNDAGDPVVADAMVTVEADDEEEGSASVRVAHLSPDAPNVDVYVDGELTIEDLPFGDVTDYLELPAGTYGIEITAAGDAETVVFDQDLEVPAGAFTIAAIGELEGDSAFEVTVIEDDVSELGEGEARVSAFHASPDAPNVDIRVAETGEALFEDVPYGEGGSVAVPAGDYRLCIYPAGGDEAVIGADVSLEAGTAYSAFATGYVGSEPMLDLSVAASDTWD